MIKQSATKARLMERITGHTGTSAVSQCHSVFKKTSLLSSHNKTNYRPLAEQLFRNGRPFGKSAMGKPDGFSGSNEKDSQCLH